MRHRKSGRKLGVDTKHRKAMFRNMATDLLRNGRINTTDTRAKEIRRVVEKLITLGKNGSLHARRKVLGYVRDRDVVEKLFSELAERYMQRPGGYTRIVKLGYRRGDNAPISLVELVTEEFRAKKKKRKKAASKPGAGGKTAQSPKKKSAEELGLVEGEAEAKAPEEETAAEPETAGEQASGVEAEKETKPAEEPEEPEKPEEPKEPEESKESEEPEAASPETEEKAEAAPAEESEAGEPARDPEAEEPVSSEEKEEKKD